MERPDLAAAMPAVARALLGEENKALSTAGELRYNRKGSLSIDLEKGAWFDHEAGVGGGVLDLIRRERGGGVREALAFLEHLGEAVTPVRALEDREHRRPAGMRDAALRIWREAKPAGGTLVDRYLRSRGLPGAGLFEAIRFHPGCPFGKDADGRARYVPAMVALMRSVVTGEPLGIHRTELTRDGRKVDRKMLGPAQGAAVMLSPAVDVDGDLGVCEGLETGLALLAMGEAPIWAMLSAGGIARMPVSHGIRRLTIYADNDAAGRRAATDGGKRWTAIGAEVRILIPATPGADFADEHAAEQGAA